MCVWGEEKREKRCGWEKTWGHYVFLRHQPSGRAACPGAVPGQGRGQRYCTSKTVAKYAGVTARALLSSEVLLYQRRWWSYAMSHTQNPLTLLGLAAASAFAGLTTGAQPQPRSSLAQSLSLPFGSAGMSLEVKRARHFSRLHPCQSAIRIGRLYKTNRVQFQLLPLILHLTRPNANWSAARDCTARRHDNEPPIRSSPSSARLSRREPQSRKPQAPGRPPSKLALQLQLIVSFFRMPACKRVLVPAPPLAVVARLLLVREWGAALHESAEAQALWRSASHYGGGLRKTES